MSFIFINILKHSEVIHCILILSNICLALETKRSMVKLLETLQDQFLIHNICLKEIYLQVGQIVKNGLNILKSKMYNEFLFCFNSIEHK